MKRIDRVDARTKLELRRDPYWYRLAEGRYLGFRKMTKGKPGTWLARFYDGEKYVYPESGISGPNGSDLSSLPDGEQFDAARRAAEEWFSHLDAGGAAKSGTVKSACETYVEKQRLEKGDTAANDAKGRFKRLVDDDPIAQVSLAKLAPRHLAEWKKRVMERAAKNGDGNPRGSFNRNATALRAALNLAHQRREVTSDLAWSEELKPFEGAAGRRTLYLDRNKRRSLIDAASGEAQKFFRVLALLPMRPGDVAKLKVEDMDSAQRVLRIPTGKTEERIIPLSSEALAHFKACAKDKLPSAWLVSRADGSQWKKEAWRDEIKLAAAAAKLPKATVAYTLRHSVITDLVKGGLDLFHVAKLAGTSVAMIEKHYGHLQADHARRALEKLALA
jgi:integrase